MQCKEPATSEGQQPAGEAIPQLNDNHRPLVGPFNITGLEALAGILGPVAMFVSESVAALSTPGYSMIRQTISSLAWTKLGWVQTIGFLAMGLMMEMYVFGLLLNVLPRRGFRISALLLVLSGFGLLMIGAFHCDVSGTLTATLQGRIHGIVSQGVFGVFPIATLLISFSLRHDARWRRLHLYTIITAATGLVLIGAVKLATDIGWSGGFERLLVLNMISWVEVTAIQLLRLSLGRESGRPTSIPRARLTTPDGCDGNAVLSDVRIREL